MEERFDPDKNSLDDIELKDPANLSFAVQEVVSISETLCDLQSKVRQLGKKVYKQKDDDEEELRAVRRVCESLLHSSFSMSRPGRYEFFCDHHQVKHIEDIQECLLRWFDDAVSNLGVLQEVVRVWNKNVCGKGLQQDELDQLMEYFLQESALEPILRKKYDNRRSSRYGPSIYGSNHGRIDRIVEQWRSIHVGVRRVKEDPSKPGTICTLSPNTELHKFTRYSEFDEVLRMFDGVDFDGMQLQPLQRAFIRYVFESRADKTNLSVDKAFLTNNRKLILIWIFDHVLALPVDVLTRQNFSVDFDITSLIQFALLSLSERELIIEFSSLQRRLESNFESCRRIDYPLLYSLKRSVALYSEFLLKQYDELLNSEDKNQLGAISNKLFPPLNVGAVGRDWFRQGVDSTIKILTSFVRRGRDRADALARDLSEVRDAIVSVDRRLARFESRFNREDPLRRASHFATIAASIATIAGVAATQYHDRRDRDERTVDWRDQCFSERFGAHELNCCYRQHFERTYDDLRILGASGRIYSSSPIFSSDPILYRYDQWVHRKNASLIRQLYSDGGCLMCKRDLQLGDLDTRVPLHKELIENLRAEIEYLEKLKCDDSESDLSWVDVQIEWCQDGIGVLERELAPIEEILRLREQVETLRRESEEAFAADNSEGCVLF